MKYLFLIINFLILTVVTGNSQSLGNIQIEDFVNEEGNVTSRTKGLTEIFAYFLNKNKKCEYKILDRSIKYSKSSSSKIKRVNTTVNGTLKENSDGYNYTLHIEFTHESSAKLIIENIELIKPQLIDAKKRKERIRKLVENIFLNYSCPKFTIKFLHGFPIKRKYKRLLVDYVNGKCIYSQPSEKLKRKHPIFYFSLLGGFYACQNDRERACDNFFYAKKHFQKTQESSLNKYFLKKLNINSNWFSEQMSKIQCDDFYKSLPEKIPLEAGKTMIDEITDRIIINRDIITDYDEDSNTIANTLKNLITRTIEESSNDTNRLELNKDGLEVRISNSILRVTISDKSISKNRIVQTGYPFGVYAEKNIEVLVESVINSINEMIFEEDKESLHLHIKTYGYADGFPVAGVTYEGEMGDYIEEPYLFVDGLGEEHSNFAWIREGDIFYRNSTMGYMRGKYVLSKVLKNQKICPNPSYEPVTSVVTNFVDEKGTYRGIELKLEVKNFGIKYISFLRNKRNQDIKLKEEINKRLD